MGKALTNPGGAFSVTDKQQQQWYESAPYTANAAIAARTLVQISTDGSVSTATTNSTTAKCIGATLNAIASGQIGEVILFGYVAGVTASGAIAEGNLMKLSVTSGGAVSASAAPAAGEKLGFAIAASASNLVDIWLFPAH